MSNSQFLILNAQYFSTRGYANGFAQYKCPILFYERLRQRLRSVQVPNTSLREATPTTSLSTSAQ
ncbi:MAG: hypothetical protein ACYTXA_23365 [Nostoc sp.]